MNSVEQGAPRTAMDAGTPPTPAQTPASAVEQDPPGRDSVIPLAVEPALRIAALALLLYACVILIWPFVSILVWSVVFAVALYPLFKRISFWLGGRRRLAAALVTLLGLFLMIGPVTWLTLGLIESVRTISDNFDLAKMSLPAPPAGVRTWPIIGEQLYRFWQLASTNVTSALAEIAPYLKPVGSSLLLIAGDAGLGFLKFLGAIVIAGFMFPAGPALAEAARKIARRLATRGDELVELGAATIRSVSVGVVGVSALQALLAGPALILAGVPAASLLTSAVLLLGIIQVGPSVVLLPLIVWSWFTMDLPKALLFTCYLVPVSLLDNFLRPVVMARGLSTPMPVILLGVLGGTIAAGITGLFLGPIVLAVVWELLLPWLREPQAQ
ncbi:MAG TPA: AI-2E family transporter [Xanthobacteraceae bacterium]|jgi:predicted PurR-regulated permease PerM|nr:AI-2E family transporter [Xanthobacteraceae bacterium]